MPNSPTVIASWFGLSLLLFGILYSFYIVIKGDKEKLSQAKWIFGLSLIAGVILTQSGRMAEVGMKHVGSIKFAKKEAIQDAADVKKIKERVEAQSATIDIVAKEAVQAKKISAEAVQTVETAKRLIDELNEKMQWQVEYGTIATLNYRGQYAVGGTVSGGSKYAGWAANKKRQFVRLVPRSKNGETIEDLVWDCDQAAIDAYKNQIDKFPRLPFPYVVLAGCLKENQISDWKEYAIKGKDILLRTTNVPGYNIEHMSFLKIVNRYLTDTQD